MQIDHIEVFVPDREEAAAWYQKALGIAVAQPYRFWAAEGGPLMLTTPDAGTKIALFRGTPQGDGEVRGLRRLAFRVDGNRFLAFLDGTGGTALAECVEQPINRAAAVDHTKSWSVYFSDPWGTLLEITTYDYEQVQQALSAA